MSLVQNNVSPSFASPAEAAPAVPEPKEGIRQFITRIAYGTAWACVPKRARVLPHIWWAVIKHFLTPGPARGMPDSAGALDFGEGLAGVCGRRTPEVALKAYATGLYPFCHVGPIKWWTPPERWVLFFDQTHLEKNLRRTLRQKKFTVTFDREFDAVIHACAEPRPGRYHLTWIHRPFLQAFKALHEMGHAHSVEVWNKDGELVGGLYGLALGRVFFTESQFFRARDASKVGFAVLNRHLQAWGFAINDGKNETPHLR
ncbi:MAG: leucyl/phenylalanyl-tRNA--protein transferase, partial [Hyphomicrobiales bacterium]